MGRCWLVWTAIAVVTSAGACGDNLPRCAQVPGTPPVALTCAHEPCTDLVVVAHPGDDLLFMGSELAGAIAASHRLIVVYVTAGELPGMSDQYWIDRERGVLNAYSAMIDARAGTRTALSAYRDDALPGGWSAAIPLELGGVTAASYELQAAPITAVFLRLGDDQEQCLWEQTNGCSTRNPHPPGLPYLAVTLACPGDAAHGGLACHAPVPASDIGDRMLAGALEAAIVKFHPTSIAMLDASALFWDTLGRADDPTGYTEYPDHYYAALYTLTATLRAAPVLGALPAITSYRGHTVARQAANLTDSVACGKDRAFDAYALFDPAVAVEQGRYALDDPASYLRRSYPLHSRVPRSGRLVTQGGCVGVVAAAPALVDCGAAPVWTYDAAGQLSTNGQCLAVIENGGHVVRPVPQCGAGPCTPIPTEFPAEVVVLEPCAAAIEYTTFVVFDDGQIRTAYARCLSATSGQLFSADCTADVFEGHATGSVPAAQAWHFD